MAIGAYIVVSPILFLMGAFSSLGFIYPQLAFRFENIFQLRQVELSFFGLVIHKVGGVFALLVTLILPLSLGVPWLLVPAILGAVFPPLYFYQTRGVVIVQDIEGDIRY